MRHFKNIGPVLLLAYICLTAGAYGADTQPTELRFNLRAGDKYLFSSIMKQHITQTVMGQQMKTTQDVTTDYIYDIRSVKDGITTIQVTFDKIKMDTDVGGLQQISFDSDNPDAASSELKAISGLIGKSFSMQVNSEGRVEKIEGLAELIGSQEGAQSELLKQSFSDSSMVQSMNMMTNIYPGKPVNVGDQWTKSFSGVLAGMMQSDATSAFTLSGIQDTYASIDMDGTMTFSKLEDGGNPMLQGAEFNLKGTQAGTLSVDITSGLPAKSELKQDISGDIEVQGMKIPMSIVSDITITAKKL